VECAPIRAQAWLDQHEHALGELRLGQVVAMIERAGLDARVVPYASGTMAAEQHRDRVTVWLTEAGEVGAVDAG
jgi:hypothetical protein